MTLPQTSILVKDKKIQQSRDQVKKVIKGTIEGLRFIKERKEESIDILARWSKVDRETATGMFESFFPAYSSDGAMTDEILRAALEDALRRAKIEKSIPINQIADRTIFSGNVAYSAAKFGLRAVHEVLRTELRGTGVRTTLISPAATNTDIWNDVTVTDPVNRPH